MLGSLNVEQVRSIIVFQLALAQSCRCKNVVCWTAVDIGPRKRVKAEVSDTIVGQGPPVVEETEIRLL